MLHDDLTFHDEVEAYCGRLSYPAGGVATLHVSSRHSHVDVVVELLAKPVPRVLRESLGEGFHVEVETGGTR